mmetsp:Transcript_741/g.1553  ORF Transcript_741/g.1553 Transcript_741/m.1553 type:complete len:943 (-) Transcript_741:140-2968(-)
MEPQDELASQLRRQISQATSEKEAAKIEAEALKRTVDGHMMRLGSLLNSEDLSHDRLAAAVQALDNDLRGRLEAADSVTRDMAHSDGTYEVLRHSLGDAQRRCQVLNNDMLRVADANEELMSTLKTLKGTNNRLVEEVQRQTEELSNLTQQRLQDLENLTHLEDSFKKEEALWQQEGRKFIEEEQNRCDEEYTRMCTQLTSQLEDCWRHARVLASKAGSLRAAHSQVKADMLSFGDSTKGELKRVERDLIDRITSSAKMLQDEQAKLTDVENNLQAKLRAEREVRETENEAWKKRHTSLAQELDDLAARRDREVSDLRAKVESAMATREREATEAASERSALHETLESHARDIALLEAKTQTARRRVLQLEAQLSQAESDRDRLQSTAEELREQIRQSDQALAEAVRCNEALREQMEVQRQESHDANDRDLKICREMYDKRLEAAAQGANAEQADLAKKIRIMEERIGTQAGELQALQEEVSEKTRKRDALQRDVHLWKGQHELAAKMRADIERELAQFRQDSVKGELHRLQETHDELQARKVEIDRRRQQVIEEATEAKRVIQEKEAAHSRRAQQVREQQAEVATETERTKAALADVESGLSLAKADFAAMTQQMTEARDGLEQEIARLMTDFEAEKGDLERRVQAERTAAISVREDFEKLRSDHRASYKATYDGPVQQVSELEGAIKQIQQQSDSELAGLRRQSDKLRLRVEELEVELQESQAKLAKSEQEVQDGTTRLGHAKSSHRTSIQNLEREKTVRLEELQQVKRSISDKSEQLKSLVRAGEEQRKRLLRNIEEAKLAKAKERDPRQSFRADRSLSFEEPLAEATSFISNRMSGAASGVTSPEVPVSLLPARDIDYGRRRMAEPPAAPPPSYGLGPFPAACTPGACSSHQYVREPVALPTNMRQVAGSLQDLGSQMQRMVASMEDRAANLRHDLQR